jgi:transcriptional regulator with XRE-family HTH domain/Zn-dependent peptidase ImmA (M78 family)
VVVRIVMCENCTVTAAEAWTEVGERVREAREAAGLTQAELAAVVGVDRTALVRVEAGQRQLNALELFRLSDRLGVPLAYFISRPPPAMVSRRALSAEPTSADRTRFRLDVALETQARDTQWLVTHGLLSPVNLPVAESGDAVGLARQARQVLGRSSGPLGPMADVAERLGVYLTVVDVDADGASVMLDTYSVAVTGAAPDPGRRRWTAAHEVGHHLLRDEYTAEVGGVSASRDEREQFVDSFAGELLLPGRDLKSALAGVPDGETRARLIAVAADYRVSWSAVVARARQCGLITTALAQRLRADTPMRGDFLSAVGWEPLPDLELGARGPQWKRAVLDAHRQGLVTAARVVELIGGDLTIEDIPDRDAL